MKSSHLFSFNFDENLLARDLAAIQAPRHKHHNTAYYEGEWSGLAIRKPSKVMVELDAGNADLDSFENTTVASSTPYVLEVMDFFKCEKTSVRLLTLTPGSGIKPHSDERLGFFDGFVRLHVPIVTNAQVEFIADGEPLTMLPGQCWFADFSKTHSVANRGTQDRVHLIMDLKVNEWLRQLFIKEGILGEDEEAPDPMDSQSDTFKKATIQALLSQGTDTSAQLARDMMKRYGLNVGEF